MKFDLSSITTIDEFPVGAVVRYSTQMLRTIGYKPHEDVWSRQGEVAAHNKHLRTLVAVEWLDTNETRWVSCSSLELVGGERG